MSQGKGFGSKGKQHIKHAESKTQNHNQWSIEMKRKSMKSVYISSDKP